MTTWATWMRRGALVGMLIPALVGGCASKSADSSQPRMLSVGEFARPRTEARMGDSVVAPIAEEVIEPKPDVTAQSAPAAAPSIVAAPAPDLAAPALLRPGEQVVIESVIGEVSGRPIFADEL